MITTVDLKKGKEFELSLLGNEINDGLCKYDSFKNCICRIKDKQRWDVSCPVSNRFANDIHALVAIALGLDDWSKLEIYNALGSALDYYHGVDFFFVIGNKRVTIDLTTNPEKIHGKADFILQEIVVDNEEFLKEFAKELAQKLS